MSPVLRIQVLPHGEGLFVLVPVTDAEAQRAKDPRVGLDGRDIVRQFVRVIRGILAAAGETVFLVREEDDADRPPWNHAEASEDVNGLHRGDAPAPVIVGALADVP